MSICQDLGIIILEESFCSDIRLVYHKTSLEPALHFIEVVVHRHSI